MKDGCAGQWRDRGEPTASSTSVYSGILLSAPASDSGVWNERQSSGVGKTSNLLIVYSSSRVAFGSTGYFRSLELLDSDSFSLHHPLCGGGQLSS